MTLSKLFVDHLISSSCANSGIVAIGLSLQVKYLRTVRSIFISVAAFGSRACSGHVFNKLTLEQVHSCLSVFNCLSACLSLCMGSCNMCQGRRERQGRQGGGGSGGGLVEKDRETEENGIGRGMASACPDITETLIPA